MNKVKKMKMVKSERNYIVHIWSYRFNEETSGSIKDDNNGFCQPFRGNMCARFIGNQTIYVTSEYSQGVKEEKFIGRLFIVIYIMME